MLDVRVSRPSAGASPRTLMKTAVRNQFPGKIRQVHAGAITAEVTLTLRGGQENTAVLTSASANVS